MSYIHGLAATVIAKSWPLRDEIKPIFTDEIIHLMTKWYDFWSIFTSCIFFAQNGLA